MAETSIVRNVLVRKVHDRNVLGRNILGRNVHWPKRPPIKETGEIGYPRRRKTKHMHNTICVGHHYMQTNTNDVHKP